MTLTTSVSVRYRCISSETCWSVTKGSCKELGILCETGLLLWVPAVYKQRNVRSVMRSRSIAYIVLLAVKLVFDYVDRNVSQRLVNVPVVYQQ